MMSGEIRVIGLSPSSNPDSGNCCTPVGQGRIDGRRPVDGETERYEYSADSIKIWFAGRSPAFGGAFIKQYLLSGHPYTPSWNYSAGSARVFASGFALQRASHFETQHPESAWVWIGYLLKVAFYSARHPVGVFSWGFARIHWFWIKLASAMADRRQARLLGIAAHCTELGHRKIRCTRTGSSTQKVPWGRTRPFVSESPLGNAGESTRKLVVARIHVYVEGGGYQFGYRRHCAQLTSAPDPIQSVATYRCADSCLGKTFQRTFFTSSALVPCIVCSFQVPFLFLGPEVPDCRWLRLPQRRDT
jgi:hypothetical protein